MVITFEEIKALVPQKYPFLMVDRVLALEPGKRAIAIKNITGNEIFFLGHFPNMAVMPGALIIESMAQTALILFRKSAEANGRVFDDDQYPLLLRGAKVRFLKPVVPGDQLQIEVTMVKAISMGVWSKPLRQSMAIAWPRPSCLLAPRARRRCNGLSVLPLSL